MADFCKANFNCSFYVIEPEDSCYDYIKLPQDINCFYPCLTDNCTKIPNSDTSCLVYECIGLMKPAVSSKQLVTTIVLSLFAVLMFISFFGGLIYRKYRSQRFLLAFEDQNLLENEVHIDSESSSEAAQPSAPTLTPDNESQH